MLEKRTIFNSTIVSKEEYEAYKKIGFVSEKGFKVEKFIYQVLFTFFTLFFAVSLVFQRGFTLSFIGGIITYIYMIIGFLPQLTLVPCSLILYTANVLTALVYLIRKSLKAEEPNNYLQKIHKRINSILAAFIIIPTVILLIVTIILNIKNKGACPPFEIQDALLNMKQNKSGSVFKVVQIFGTFSMALGFVITILLCFVKDANNFGVK
ncbi:hypothetical protein PIROE2DRAFT_8133, partial [Piromyces sp. E2]